MRRRVTEIFVSLKILVILLLMLFSQQVFGTEYGSDLLNGIGDFETVDDRAAWTLHTWSGDSALNKFDSELPHSGDWSWHFGPSTAYGNTWGGWTTSKFSTVANREHRLIVYARSQVSTPSWIQYVIGGSGWQSLSYYTTVWGYNEKYYTSGATEETMEVAFKMHANSANDNGYIDDVTVCRERVMPTVYSDSVQSTLVIGEVTEVIFDTTPYITYDPRNAFDPDIGITCTNATISNIQWISDTNVSADITASSIGQLQLVFRNDYSDMEYTYSMNSVNPPTSCGDPGTVYDIADMNLDCVVNLLDFSVLAIEWLECTDPEAGNCF